MEVLVDTPSLRIIRVANVGPDGNNIYLIVDPSTEEAAFIDAPAEPEKAIEIARGVRPTKILMTHTHADHTVGLETLTSHYGATVHCHPAEPYLNPTLIDRRIEHGEMVEIGATRWTSIHNPGHTPGSTSYFRSDRFGAILFSGDTLFPGGPGWSATPVHLREEIASIRERLFTLPPETVVYPGHGDSTTIRQARAEYEVFASKPHPDDLHGDVLWLTS